MTAPEEERAGLGKHRFHENVQLTSTDQTVVVRGILAQMKGQVLRLAGGDGLARGRPDFGFDAAAAYGTHHGTVLAYQELGGFVTGDGAANFDDCGQSAGLARPPEPDQLLVDVHRHELYHCEFR